jgi:hypothetical protein
MVVDCHSLEDASVKAELHANTDEAISRGAFGVPSVWVPDTSGGGRLYFGQDRMHFVGARLGVADASLSTPLRLTSSPTVPAAVPSPHKTIHFYHDFSSPWSFMGSLQVTSPQPASSTPSVCRRRPHCAAVCLRRSSVWLARTTRRWCTSPSCSGRCFGRSARQTRLSL